MNSQRLAAIARFALGTLASLALPAGRAAGASVQKSISLKVCGGGQPLTLTTNAPGNRIAAGDPITVSWSSAEADRTLRVPLSSYWEGDRALAASGSKSLTGLRAGTHELVVRSADACSPQLEAYATIEVLRPPTVTLTASTNWPNTSDQVTLNWSCADCGGGVTASSNLGAPSGINGTVYDSNGGAEGQKTFSLTAANALGVTATRSLTVVWTTPQPPDDNCCDCFAAGTKITLADGSTKGVEQLQVGDLVRSFDPKTGKAMNVKVLTAATNKRGNYLQINGGKGVTLDHKFYVNGVWKNAADLKVGDQLVDETGKAVAITSIETRPGPVTVYPITVEDPPATYIAEGVVVHNRKGLARNEGLLEGTKVTMADGRRLPIEQVRPGDLVMSFSPKTGALAPFKVLKASKETAERYSIVNGTLKMAGNHKLFQPRPASKAKGATKGAGRAQ